VTFAFGGQRWGNYGSLPKIAWNNLLSDVGYKWPKLRATVIT
jgi:hypothetical protein